MNSRRRQILKSAGSASALGIAIAAGLLKPSQVLAVTWDKAAFDSKTVPDVLNAIGATGAMESDQIKLKMPDIAENGTVVPVEVSTNLPGVESIVIIAEKNGTPLLAKFALSNGAAGVVSIRVKLATTTNVRVVVKADGKTYTAAKEVKVTVGGCGG